MEQIAAAKIKVYEFPEVEDGEEADCDLLFENLGMGSDARITIGFPFNFVSFLIQIPFNRTGLKKEYEPTHYPF